MILDLNDRQSPTWAKIKAHLAERLNDHRVDNDKRVSPEDTAYLRGRIAEIKYLISLGDEEA